MPILNKAQKRIRLPNTQAVEAYNNRLDIYSSKEWKRIRSAKLQALPLCECCLIDDKITPAIDVHHVTSFTGYTGDQKLLIAYDPNNLASLCKQCHNKIHHNKEFRSKYTLLLMSKAEPKYFF